MRKSLRSPAQGLKCVRLTEHSGMFVTVNVADEDEHVFAGKCLGYSPARELIGRRSTTGSVRDPWPL
jgi:hypothetical protein